MLTVLFLIILISNSLLVLISQVFQIGNTTKLSSALFNACAGDWINGYSVSEFDISRLGVKEIFGDYTTGFVFPDKWKYNGMVNPDNFLYLPSLIAGIALAIALVVAVLNLAKRVYEIIFMYFVMPMSMSTLPLDDGARFKTWRETFITKIVIAYGTVFSVNIFVLLLPLITRMRIDEISGFGNSMFLIFMIVGGARMCSVCSYVDERDTDALGHSYKDTVVDPSCTERGNTIHECERCGHTYTDSYTDATGHDFGEWTSLTKPTCTASGVDQRKCTNCPQTETKIVSPLGHNYKAEIVEPTCLEQGYTTHTCSRCGTGYNDTFVPPLGHDYEEIEVAPTCTEEGYRGKKCRRCEDCIKTEILKAVGHKFTDSYFIATCEEEGYTLHTCLSCGNEYKDNIVPATGHDYETEVVREPHCETEGERKFHCTKCEKEYYSDIPATGHNYELTGTEEVNGENIRTYVCTNCGAITTQNMGEQYEQVSSYIEYLFEQYQPYMWWVLLATAGVWSIVMGVFFAIAQKNEDKEKARKMIKNYVIGLVVIFAILVACPYLVKGIAALIAG